MSKIAIDKKMHSTKIVLVKKRIRQKSYSTKKGFDKNTFNIDDLLQANIDLFSSLLFSFNTSHTSAIPSSTNMHEEEVQD